MSSEIEQYQPRGEVAIGQDPTGGRLVAWAQAASAANALARSLVQTSFVPRIKVGGSYEPWSVGDATAAIIMGDELGLTPLTALRSIYVVKGTPAMYARTLVALVQSRGHEVWTERSTLTEVIVCGQRAGSEHIERAVWTIERATKAGYTSNEKYRTNPMDMLWARAASEVCRRIAADAIAGIPYSVEEVETEPGEPTAVAREPRRVSRAPRPEPVEPELPEPPQGSVESDQPPADDTPAPAEQSEDEAPVSGGGGITTRQHAKIAAGLRDLNITDAAAARAYCTRAIGREVKSRKDLSHDEASDVITCIEYDLTHPNGPDDAEQEATR